MAKRSQRRREMCQKEVAKGSWAAWAEFSVPYKVQTREEGIKQNIEHYCYEG
jgi:hypothetical protein